MKTRLVVLPLVGILFGGCATFTPGAGFSDIERFAEERLEKRVRWDQATPEDGEAARALGELLEREMSADDAVQVALLNNRNLRATYEALGIAQADLVRAGLLRNPVFDAEIRFHGGAGTSMELGLVENFLEVFFLPLRMRVAETEFERAKAGVAAAVLDLAGEARAAFYRYQGAEQLREMRESVVAATDASSDFADRLNRAGNLTDLDRANERAMHEEARLELASAEVEVLETRERMNALMGLWGGRTDWKAKKRLPEPPAEGDAAEGIETTAIRRSIDLQLAKSEIIANALRLGIARPAAVLDEAEGGATGERETDGKWGLGPAVVVPIPIFDWGQAASAAAASMLRQSEERYAALAVEVRSAAREAWGRTEKSRTRALHYRKALLPLRRRIVAETQLQYNAMLVGAFQLLLAKQQEIESGGRYIEALRDYWLARTELNQILSGRIAERVEDTSRESVTARSTEDTKH